MSELWGVFSSKQFHKSRGAQYHLQTLRARAWPLGDHHPSSGSAPSPVPQCPRRPGPVHGWVMTSQTLSRATSAPGHGQPGDPRVWAEGTLNPTSFPPPAMAKFQVFLPEGGRAAPAAPPPSVVKAVTLPPSSPSRVPHSTPPAHPSAAPECPPRPLGHSACWCCLGNPDLTPQESEQIWRAQRGTEGSWGTCMTGLGWEHCWDS